MTGGVRLKGSPRSCTKPARCSANSRPAAKKVSTGPARPRNVWYSSLMRMASLRCRQPARVGRQGVGAACRLWLRAGCLPARERRGTSCAWGCVGARPRRAAQQGERCHACSTRRGLLACSATTLVLWPRNRRSMAGRGRLSSLVRSPPGPCPCSGRLSLCAARPARTRTHSLGQLPDLHDGLGPPELILHPWGLRPLSARRRCPRSGA